MPKITADNEARLSADGQTEWLVVPPGEANVHVGGNAIVGATTVTVVVTNEEGKVGDNIDGAVPLEDEDGEVTKVGNGLNRTVRGPCLVGLTASGGDYTGGNDAFIRVLVG